MVVWLASGGRVEVAADAARCAHVLGLYQSALATGQSLLWTKQGETRVVLDVRCNRRGDTPVS